MHELSYTQFFIFFPFLNSYYSFWLIFKCKVLKQIYNNLKSVFVLKKNAKGGKQNSNNTPSTPKVRSRRLYTSELKEKLFLKTDK